ncbi:MAG TPA: hypothetical protein VFB98_01455 [Candidatus Deferrimicrobium sp.]|nr:hypothetical protein [Candidatus Deferrimicrobium sp.]
MDQTILFVFPRHSDFGRLTTAGDVRTAASDLANIQRLLEATPDDLNTELAFVAQRILTDAAFAVRYESLLMILTDDRSFDAWALLHPALEPVEREHLRLLYHHNVFDLYVLLQDVLCPDSVDLMNAPSEEAHS